MSNALDENWRPIPGFEGAYSISDQGRARSEPRQIAHRGAIHTLRGRILKTPKGKKGPGGYACFNARRDGRTHHFFVHQVVMLAFVGPPPKGQEVRHLDGDPSNNRLSNLAYGTRAQNIDDAKRHGTFPVLEMRPGAILTRQQAIEIAESNEIADVLAERYGVCRGAIQDVRRGRSWSKVTSGRRRKDYRPRGSLNHRAILSEEQVLAIVRSSASRADAAAAFAVSPATIKSIRSGRSWNAVTGIKQPSIDPTAPRPDSVINGAAE